MNKLLVIYFLVLISMLATACGHTGGEGGKGVDGKVGVPGFVPSVITIPADASQCPTGGSAITVTTADSSQTSYVCNGAIGNTGATGADGSKGDTGDVGAVGPQGPQGVAGNDGANGSDGHDGANGSDGHDGTNATPVTLIKFCSETPSYPSTFVEYGICVDNQLYAVYSANGGFLALLPPGPYSSNGIGSSCNFTVTANCGVVR